MGVPDLQRANTVLEQQEQQLARQQLQLEQQQQQLDLARARGLELEREIAGRSREIATYRGSQHAADGDAAALQEELRAARVASEAKGAALASALHALRAERTPLGPNPNPSARYAEDGAVAGAAKIAVPSAALELRAALQVRARARARVRVRVRVRVRP